MDGKTQNIKYMTVLYVELQINTLYLANHTVP